MDAVRRAERSRPVRQAREERGEIKADIKAIEEYLKWLNATFRLPDSLELSLPVSLTASTEERLERIKCALPARLRPISTRAFTPKSRSRLYLLALANRRKGKVPMRNILLIAGASLALAACNLQAPASAGTIPTHLPSSVTVDDQVGISVELAYQAASLAERTAVAAGFVTPAQAKALLALDNEAYTAVCSVRTAYDVANGNDPSKRVDHCPSSTKANRYVTYVEAGRQALAMIQALVSTTVSYERSK